ncbi:MAG TPA: hypothetical protein VE152_12300, partial [Acidimicrobiales bacterium]|nr:hypothetical protein [Acidimicrobiales bacterium]
MALGRGLFGGLAVAVVVGLTALAVGAPRPAGATTVGAPAWSASSTTAGDSGVTDTYRFTAATDATVSRVTMTVPPGTGGHPAVGTVSPGGLAGGSVSLSGTTLTYSFPPTRLAAGTRVSITVSGLTNPGAPGSYTSTITTARGSSPVDSGTTPAVTFTGDPPTGHGPGAGAATAQAGQRSPPTTGGSATSLGAPA